MDLTQYDLIIINSSGGKDSLCALHTVATLALEQNYPSSKITVSHQDLGRMEWANTKALAIQQADLYGIKTVISKRIDINGKEETLLEYVLRRGKWPSNKQRYCTSDFKRGPGARVVTALSKPLGACKVLHVFGFRADESPSRSKKEVIQINKKLTTKKRTVIDWLPIHDWSMERVWKTIKDNSLPYHHAYDLGMPRLSCVFCIFSPFDALIIAGIANPQLLDEYVEVESTINHSFKSNFWIKEVKQAIAEGYQPKTVTDWVM